LGIRVYVVLTMNTYPEHTPYPPASLST
jgi:hypothetical protein